ncbi:MAG: hypothetical protein GKR94_10565 [Gammaproteobacteria bacterium]|nr:hypothetical protein [Gammaproteobacteria bacterium]
MPVRAPLQWLLGGGQGEALHRRITTLRGEYFNARGNPRGDYQRCKEQESELDQKLQDKREELAQYEEKVDRLEEKQTELQAYRENKELEKAGEWVRSASGAAKHVADLRARVQADTELLRRREAELSAAQQALDNRNKSIKELKEAQESQRAAERAVGDKEPELTSLDERLAELQQRLEALKVRQRDKDAELRLARDAETLRKLVAEHDRLDSQLRAARNADSQRRRCASESDVIRVSEKAVATLKKMERTRDLAAERLKAAATRIEYRLQPGVVVRWGDQPLAGDGSVLLNQRTELQVEGVGQFSVIPGREDLGALRRKVERQDQQLAQALAEVDAGSVADAQASVHQKNALDGQAAQHAATLKGLAPEGLPALEDRVGTVAAQRESLQRKLGDEADKAFDAGGLEAEVQSLQDQVGKVESDVVDEEKVRQQLREALAGRRAEKTSAERLVRKHASDLEQARDGATDDELIKAVKDAQQQVNASNRHLEEAKQALDGQNPEAVEAEVERSNRVLDDIRQVIETLDRDVRDLKVELMALGQPKVA